MKVGFIGYGNMAEALGSRWAGKHDVFVGGRDASKARGLADKLGHGTKSGSEADAAAFAEVVVLATPHEAVFDAMRVTGGPGAIAGKALLDINNPVVDDARRLPRQDVRWQVAGRSHRRERPGRTGGQGVQRVSSQSLANGPARVRRPSIGHSLLRR